MPLVVWGWGLYPKKPCALSCVFACMHGSLHVCDCLFILLCVFSEYAHQPGRCVVCLCVSFNVCVFMSALYGSSPGTLGSPAEVGVFEHEPGSVGYAPGVTYGRTPFQQHHLPSTHSVPHTQLMGHYLYLLHTLYQTQTLTPLLQVDVENK